MIAPGVADRGGILAVEVVLPAFQHGLEHPALLQLPQELHQASAPGALDLANMGHRLEEQSDVRGSDRLTFRFAQQATGTGNNA